MSVVGDKPVLGKPGVVFLVDLVTLVDVVAVPPTPVLVAAAAVSAGLVAESVAAGVVGVATTTAQVVLVTVLVSRVTAPLRARTRPFTVAPVVRVIEVRAKIFPLKAEPVPRVAELPTCQKMLQAWAPLTSATTLLLAVIRVEAVLKTKTASVLFWASRVSVPVMPKVPEAES